MMKNFEDLKDWLKTSRKGARHTYHTGVLAADRREDADLDKLAKSVLTAYQTGLVEVFQKRLGKNKYEYIVERTKTSARPFKGVYALD